VSNFGQTADVSFVDFADLLGCKRHGWLVHDVDGQALLSAWTYTADVSI